MLNFFYHLQIIEKEVPLPLIVYSRTSLELEQEEATPQVAGEGDAWHPRGPLNDINYSRVAGQPGARERKG